MGSLFMSARILRMVSSFPASLAMEIHRPSAPRPPASRKARITAGLSSFSTIPEMSTALDHASSESSSSTKRGTLLGSSSFAVLVRMTASSALRSTGFFFFGLGFAATGAGAATGAASLDFLTATASTGSAATFDFLAIAHSPLPFSVGIDFLLVPSATSGGETAAGSGNLPSPPLASLSSSESPVRSMIPSWASGKPATSMSSRPGKNGSSSPTWILFSAAPPMLPPPSMAAALADSIAISSESWRS
mmetsp:Transcript_42336/g.135560  ORF Transcript_42336/g.135560 Transcript_42336/m.135560 type:complete len:248 (-) Transcript_42336:978-1721(-)